MGYLVATTGRLHLPSHLERQALTVAEHRMSGRQGWLDPDEEHVETLADLATYAGVTLSRDGDWLTVTTDHEGDPKWSEQAEEFYRALAGFVREGEVHLRGEDGSTWTYRYSDDGVEQTGDNGWDRQSGGSDAGPAPSPVAEHPAAGPPEPASPAEPEPRPDPLAEPPGEPEPPGGFSYPGKEERPPSAAPPPTPPVPSWSPGEDDEAPPASRGRVLAMTALLVVGVLLIIGLALFAAGF